MTLYLIGLISRETSFNIQSSHDIEFNLGLVGRALNCGKSLSVCYWF